MEKKKQTGTKRKTYICCCSDKRSFYEAKIGAEHPEQYILQDKMEGADLVIVCGPVTEQMEREMEEACRKKIRTVYDGRDRNTYRDAILSNKKSVEVQRPRRTKSFQRER